ncbi:hypothetical protein EDB83DRAFT_875149 [Lactarius deliciosus]|nr:hypothetical protein EDB83DRAFT_875149 [Lactarius deliciosus]
MLSPRGAAVRIADTALRRLLVQPGAVEVGCSSPARSGCCKSINRRPLRTLFGRCEKDSERCRCECGMGRLVRRGRLRRRKWSHAENAIRLEIHSPRCSKGERLPLWLQRHAGLREALDDRRSHSRNAQTAHADDAKADLDSILPLLGHHPSTRPWTSLVSESPTPLQTLKRLVHDFPKYATSLARRIVPQSSLLEEMSSNSCKIRPGVSAVWLYGARVPPGKPVEYTRKAALCSP